MALTDVHRRQRQSLTPRNLDLISKLLGTLPRPPGSAVGRVPDAALLAQFNKLRDPELRNRVLVLLELLADP